MNKQKVLELLNLLNYTNNTSSACLYFKYKQGSKTTEARDDTKDFAKVKVYGTNANFKI